MRDHCLARRLKPSCSKFHQISQHLHHQTLLRLGPTLVLKMWGKLTMSTHFVRVPLRRDTPTSFPQVNFYSIRVVKKFQVKIIISDIVCLLLLSFDVDVRSCTRTCENRTDSPPGGNDSCKWRQRGRCSNQSTYRRYIFLELFSILLNWNKLFLIFIDPITTNYRIIGRRTIDTDSISRICRLSPITEMCGKYWSQCTYNNYRTIGRRTVGPPSESMPDTKFKHALQKHFKGFSYITWMEFWSNIFFIFLIWKRMKVVNQFLIQNLSMHENFC